MAVRKVRRLSVNSGLGPFFFANLCALHHLPRIVPLGVGRASPESINVAQLINNRVDPAVARYLGKAAQQGDSRCKATKKSSSPPCPIVPLAGENKGNWVLAIKNSHRVRKGRCRLLSWLLPLLPPSWPESTCASWPRKSAKAALLHIMNRRRARAGNAAIMMKMHNKKNHHPSPCESFRGHCPWCPVDSWPRRRRCSADSWVPQSAGR